MQKLLIFFIALIVSSTAISQDTLPKFTIVEKGDSTLLQWVNPYQSVSSINIQRSAFVDRDFKTIASITDVEKQNNFIDRSPGNLNMYYRLFISYPGGNYIYTPALSLKKGIAVKPVTEKKILVSAVKGLITDSANNNLIPNATITLIEAGSNKETKSTFTKEDGSFELNNLQRGKYQIIISNAGYRSKTITVNVFIPVMDLGKIIISSTAILLTEVQVVKNKTLIERDVDKLTYHVESDPESRTLTALDMLRKIPMVSVDGEDNIQLNGSSNYLVLINGKTSSLFIRNPANIFKGMPASTIKDIEIITNPSSKYQAQGVGGIINLITYKTSLGGYNGSVNITASRPRGFAITSYLSAKAKKFNFSVQLGNNSTTNPLSSSNFYREDKARKSKLKQNGESNSKNELYNISIESSYEIDSANIISGSYSINSSKGVNNFRQNIQLINGAGSVTEANLNSNTGTNKWKGNDISLDYQRSFKKKDQAFTASYKYDKSINDNPSFFLRKNLTANSSQESHTDNRSFSTDHTLQADYTHPFKMLLIETGIKSTIGFNSSDYYYTNRDSVTGKFILDSARSDNFEYEQNIHAAYTSVNYKKSNWGIKAGLRLEQTAVDATFTSTGTFAKQQYINLMPNISISRKLKGSTLLRFSFSQRIERPSLSYLNPYIDLYDPRNISYGNPAVQPALSNVFNLFYNTYINTSSISAGIFYISSNNTVQQFTTLGSDDIARTTYGNIASNKTSGLSLSGNTTLLKKITVNVNATSSYVNYASKFLIKAQQGFIFNVTGYGSYAFSKSWRASSNIGYSSSGIFLQGRKNGYIWNSISVFKDFLQDNRTTFNFTVTSPFQKNRRLFTNLYDPAFIQIQETFVVNRRYSLAFNYRFSKVQ